MLNKYLARLCVPQIILWRLFIPLIWLRLFMTCSVTYTCHRIHIIICYMLQKPLTQVLTSQISWTMLDQFPSQEIIISSVLLISCKLGMEFFFTKYQITSFKTGSQHSFFTTENKSIFLILLVHLLIPFM